MSEKNWSDMTADEQADHAAKGLLDRYREQNTDEVNLEDGIYRHCGVQPGDDWVKRVERLNAIIDGFKKEYDGIPSFTDPHAAIAVDVQFPVNVVLPGAANVEGKGK
jgi:hypothetical protein